MRSRFNPAVAPTRPMEYISRGAQIFLPLFRWIATELSGDFSMPNDFLVEAKRHADVAHLILQRFDYLAVDELEQPWATFDQDDRNAEGGENRRILAADHSTADDGQRLRQLLQRQ